MFYHLGIDGLPPILIKNLLGFSAANNSRLATAVRLWTSSAQSCQNGRDSRESGSD
jgi:hypothetical protein